MKHRIGELQADGFFDEDDRYLQEPSTDRRACDDKRRMVSPGLRRIRLYRNKRRISRQDRKSARRRTKNTATIDKTDRSDLYRLGASIKYLHSCGRRIGAIEDRECDERIVRPKHITG